MTFPTFGTLLRQLRKRAGMTQGDLAAAVGYSVSFICDLEQNRRLPAIAIILQQFIPALGLQEEAGFATQLIELAALARGERPSPTLTLQRTAHLLVTETFTIPPSRLPAPPTELIGREQAIKTIYTRLQGHSGRLLTLVGPPGVGKTRLGLAVATRVEALFKDGARFVPLAGVSDPDLVATIIANKLELIDTGKQSPQERLIQSLRQKELLLVLDNFEQILAAAGLLATLLTECPRLYLLVTSRERLHLRAEQRFRVLPLEVTFALELFIQRARAVDSDFELTLENQRFIEEICQRLDYLPLAIELSAAWVRVLSCTEIAQEIAHNLHFLTSTLRDIPERHRSLYAVFDYSWRLLSPEEQSGFARLSVFRGRFTREAALYVTGISLPIMSALIDKSVVRRNPPVDYELHEYARQFAAAKLHERGELQAIRERHEAYFVAQAQEELQRLRATVFPFHDTGENASKAQIKLSGHQTSSLLKQKALRVLMLSWEYPPYVTGGIGKHVADLAPALNAITLDDGPLLIDILTIRVDDGEREERINPTLSIYGVDRPLILRSPFTRALPNNALPIESINHLIQQNNYDLIHIQDCRLATIGLVLKDQWHLPLIATIHSIERKRYQQTPPDDIDQIEQIERKLCNEAEQVIVCSQFMRQELHDHFGTQYDKINVIANGMKVKAREEYSPEKLEALRQQYAPVRQKLLLFVGSATLEKGLLVLLRAMPRILAEHPNTRLLVVGGYGDKIRSFAYELNVEKAIDFLGYISDQQRDCLYQIVDAMIIPSLYEPFGRVALEAMAFGCNVIASRVGGLGEVVKHLENGLTIQPNDPQSIEHAVNLLFTNPVAAQQRRARALNELHTLYQWDMIATQTAQVYQAAVRVHI